MKKVHYNKLIRDNIPAKMDRKGVRYEVRTLTQKECKNELLKKVGEEASALPIVKSKKELVDELADVLDVIDEILQTFKIDKKALREAQKANVKKKGGFAKRVFLKWSEDKGYKTNERTHA